MELVDSDAAGSAVLEWEVAGGGGGGTIPSLGIVGGRRGAMTDYNDGSALGRIDGDPDYDQGDGSTHGRIDGDPDDDQDDGNLDDLEASNCSGLNISETMGDYDAGSYNGDPDDDMGGNYSIYDQDNDEIDEDDDNEADNDAPYIYDDDEDKDEDEEEEEEDDVADDEGGYSDLDDEDAAKVLDSTVLGLSMEVLILNPVMLNTLRRQKDRERTKRLLDEFWDWLELNIHNNGRWSHLLQRARHALNDDDLNVKSPRFWNCFYRRDPDGLGALLAAFVSYCLYYRRRSVGGTMSFGHIASRVLHHAYEVLLDEHPEYNGGQPSAVNGLRRLSRSYPYWNHFVKSVEGVFCGRIYLSNQRADPILPAVLNLLCDAAAPNTIGRKSSTIASLQYANASRRVTVSAVNVREVVELEGGGNKYSFPALTSTKHGTTSTSKWTQRDLLASGDGYYDSGSQLNRYLACRSYNHDLLKSEKLFGDESECAQLSRMDFLSALCNFKMTAHRCHGLRRGRIVAVIVNDILQGRIISAGDVRERIRYMLGMSKGDDTDYLYTEGLCDRSMLYADDPNVNKVEDLPWSVLYPGTTKPTIMYRHDRIKFGNPSIHLYLRVREIYKSVLKRVMVGSMRGEFAWHV